MASCSDLLIFLEQKLSYVKDLCELSEQEKKRILDLASGMDRIIILLLLETGLDLECLIYLRVSDLDIENGQLRIAQNRMIQLSSGALNEIKQFLESRPGQVYLLEGRCAKPVTSKWKRCVLENLIGLIIENDKNG